MAAGELMRALTVNTGSTSLKIERYDLPATLPPIEQPPDPAFSAEPHLDAAEQALRAALSEVDVVVHRFVQLPYGTPPVSRLDAIALATIVSAGADDPLHDAAAARVVEIIRHEWPAIPQYAVSDSAFHRTMTEAATTYALPRAVTGATLHRIGYHGLSHEYVAHRGCAVAGIDIRRSRVVTAHLGGGSSLCAVRDGASIDTTMGYTPLDGLPMATRSGSVDPGLLLHLLRGGMSLDALDDMLERRSGLLGISGISGDVRELLSAGAHSAHLALDVLAWRLRSALGSMIAVLGGVDLIVFTGGIGENAAPVRAAALENGLGVGAFIDERANATVDEGTIGRAAGVAVAVVPTREGWQLARAAAGLPAQRSRDEQTTG